MYNITLIGTYHSEIGKCNSGELYKIIEYINPEVIFVELPNNVFYEIICDMAINGIRSEEPTETKFIKNYLQNHNNKLIPVDDEVRYISDSEYDQLLYTFEEYDDYKELVYEQISLTKQYGFDYLNSEKCLDLLEQTRIVEKNIMELEIHKNKLLHFYKLFYKENDTRENSMLQNIYNYSRENQYNQAVFLTGIAHRKSIMQKIIENEKMSEIKLNWSYGNKQKTSR